MKKHKKQQIKKEKNRYDLLLYPDMIDYDRFLIFSREGEEFLKFSKNYLPYNGDNPNFFTPKINLYYLNGDERVVIIRKMYDDNFNDYLKVILNNEVYLAMFYDPYSPLVDKVDKMNNEALPLRRISLVSFECYKLDFANGKKIYLDLYDNLSFSYNVKNYMDVLS